MTEEILKTKLKLKWLKTIVSFYVCDLRFYMLIIMKLTEISNDFEFYEMRRAISLLIFKILIIVFYSCLIFQSIIL